MYIRKHGFFFNYCSIEQQSSSGIKIIRFRAAVSIQRCYRYYKGVPNPPPSTPMLHYQDFMYRSMSSIKLDYEAYVKMRRSIDPSIFSMKSVHFGETDWKMRGGDLNPKVLKVNFCRFILVISTKYYGGVYRVGVWVAWRLTSTGNISWRLASTEASSKRVCPSVCHTSFTNL